MLKSFKGYRGWIWLTIIVIILDQTTKYFVTVNSKLHTIKPIFSWFAFTLEHNTGAAFSFLSNAGGWQRWFLSVVSIIVILILLSWIRYSAANTIMKPAGASLVLGGAVGNLIDRLLHGYVIDFILLHYSKWYFPVFNIADSAITLGIIFLIIKAFSKDQK